MFTDHKKFAPAPAAPAGVSAEEKQALLDVPVVYGLPAKPKEPVAEVRHSGGAIRLYVLGIEIDWVPHDYTVASARFRHLAEKINNAAKEKGL